MRAIVSCSIVVVLLSAPAPSASASDIHVPADYATIQAAIDAAVNGDSVLVDPGTYFENINFKGKAITVQSTSGPTVTTIDGGLKASCVRFASGEGNASILRGFTLTHGGVLGAGYQGGGVHVEYSSPTIEGNVIVRNVAQNGGGLYFESSSAIAVGNVIFKNFATGGGGGVCFGGGATPVMVGTLIYENSAISSGGGVYCSSSHPLLVNTTIAYNSSGSSGGGMLSYESIATATNCILWGNSPDSFHDGGNGQLIATTSDIEGGWAGSGNIDVDPLFVNPATNDFHLAEGSPCIDVGDDAAPNLPATDIDGDARIIGPHVDMGADEAVLPPVVFSVSPGRTRYEAPVSVTISGTAFTIGTGATVTVGGASASNVVVVDNTTITCDFPAGPPGPADVVVSNSRGSGTLSGGFDYTPAMTFDGNATPGGTITLHYLFDAGEGVFAIFGLPPEVSFPTPPFDGTLCVAPFDLLFYLPYWPFQDFSLTGTIPNDPSIIGVDVLLQALIGPALTGKPRDGSWTNCLTLPIR